MKKHLLKITIATVAVMLVFAFVPLLALAAPAQAPQRQNGTIRMPAVEFAVAEGEENPFFTSGTRALISAHRAGGAIAPENTLSAFHNCIANAEGYRPDLLEFDVHLTADNHLILLHDATLDRTSNCVELFGETEVKPRSKKLRQLKELNMAENFMDPDTGLYPFRGLRGDAIPDDCRIVTLDEVLEYCENYWHENRPDAPLHYTIELKDAGADGRTAADMLHSKLVEMDLMKRVIVGGFNGDITDYLDDKYPDFIRAAGIIEVLRIFICYLLNRNLTNTRYEILVVPYIKLFPFLGSAKFIAYAHRYNIACHYWTINTEGDMRTLIANGADCIITDNPKLGCKVVNTARAAA